MSWENSVNFFACVTQVCLSTIVDYNIPNGGIRSIGLVNRYLVTSFSVVPRGTEGAVSLEGTGAGLVASVILAAVAYSINLVLCYLSGSPINCVLYVLLR